MSYNIEKFEAKIQEAFNKGFDMDGLCFFRNSSNSQISINYEMMDEKRTANVDLYRLIFGTDFIDKLVGDGVVCFWCGNELFINNMGWDHCACNAISCSVNKAHYHRQRLANMSFDPMIDYINGLGE